MSNNLTKVAAAEAALATASVAFPTNELSIAASELVVANAASGPMLTLRSDMIIGESLRTVGTFQEEKIREVSAYLSATHQFQTKTFVDVGANIGTHLIFALRGGGYQHAVGIEPDLTNFCLLRCNVLLNRDFPLAPIKVNKLA